jgi:NADH-quinone oxidoreductase subunit H
MLILYYILKILAIIVPLLIAVAYFTLAERKVMGSIQRRRGPDVVGYKGLLQPLADGLKLFAKETILPSNANKGIFILAPLITFSLSLVGWGVIPFDQGVVLSNINLGILYLFAVTSLEVYGVICAGWASNSKYPFLGALRSAAQMVSYEVSIGFVLVTIILCAGSLNLTEIVLAQETVWYVFPLLPMAVIFFISALAETNRHPFDLPEAESELVSGYNFEYSAMGLAFFFLGEYASMLLMSSLTVIFFWGGWLPISWLGPFSFLSPLFWFGAKTIVFCFLFIVARAVVPRYRYDQLMRLGWKVFLPISILGIISTATILLCFNWLPA